MKKLFHLVSAITMATLFTRCATLNVDKARLSGIKKVAVTGFVVAQEMPKGPQFSLIGSARDRDNGMMAAWTSSLPHASEHSTDMYARLATALKKELKWNVTDRKALESNSAYHAIYDRFMKGLQSRPPIGTNVTAFGATGVMDPYPIDQMSLEERKQLMKSLNVDALAVATIRIKLEKAGGLKMLLGAGDYKPVAEIAFAVYDSKGKDPVWRDLQATGDVVAEGAEHVFGITDMKTLMNATIQAAQLSYDKLLARYRDHNENG